MRGRDIQTLYGKIKRLEDAIRHERELREEYIKNSEANLKLQAAEYERRLDMLNHAHTAALEAQRKTVPRETFDNYREDQDRWRAHVNATLAETKGAAETAAQTASKVVVSSQLWLMVIGVALAVLTLVLRLLDLPAV